MIGTFVFNRQLTTSQTPPSQDFPIMIRACSLFFITSALNNTCQLNVWAVLSLCLFLSVGPSSANEPLRSEPEVNEPPSNEPQVSEQGATVEPTASKSGASDPKISLFQAGAARRDFSLSGILGRLLSSLRRLAGEMGWGTVIVLSGW